MIRNCPHCHTQTQGDEVTCRHCGGDLADRNTTHNHNLNITNFSDLLNGILAHTDKNKFLYSFLELIQKVYGERLKSEQEYNDKIVRLLKELYDQKLKSERNDNELRLSLVQESNKQTQTDFHMICERIDVMKQEKNEEIRTNEK